MNTEVSRYREEAGSVATFQDPAGMEAQARLSEVARILAVGYLRCRQKERENTLASSRPDWTHGRKRSENGGDCE
jgi:hypothetical protein